MIATLSGIVTSFYKKQVADYEKRERSLESRIELLERDRKEQREEVRECHRQREEIRVELASVRTRLELLEQSIPCPKIQDQISIEKK